MKTSLKVRKCSCCREPFMQQRPLQKLCGHVCATKDAEARHARRVAAQKRQERRSDRAHREELKTLPTLIAEAQKEFNAYIRERDKDQLCICCGRPLGASDVGGAFDCGHYRSTGSASHLRFNEDNAHAQRKDCNRWGAGRAVDYRLGLVARIGLEAVEALESSNEPKKWTKDEVRAIRDTYRARVREMKKASRE